MSSFSPALAHWPVPGLAAAPVYNEAAFRYFLTVDCQHAIRSQRPVLLVLVAVRDGAGRSSRLSRRTASAIFSGLVTSVREVDLVGWFREDRVAGALLILGAAGPDTDVVGRAASRVRAELTRRLPPPFAPRLRVRVRHLGGRNLTGVSR